MRVELLAVTPNAEQLIEEAGRTCYQSREAGAADRRRFIFKLVKSGHHSVLEHAYATFRITGVSRSFTHQLVRHRLCAYSQQSQRHVDEENFAFIEPPAIAKDTDAHCTFEKFIEEARLVYGDLQRYGIKNEDARFVLPNAVCSEIVLSANFRELRHIFCMRCSAHAQWEIRAVAMTMLNIMKKEASAVFADFEITAHTGTATTRFPS